MDLLSEIMKYDNSASLSVFLYNISSNDIGFVQASDGGVTLATISASHNHSRSDYIVDSELFAFARDAKEAIEKISIEDFGITVIMLHYAKYMSCNRFVTLAYEFMDVPEFELIRELNLNAITMQKNLATDKVYGLKALKFEGRCFLTVRLFNKIITAMCSMRHGPNRFVSDVSEFHINIIESFYIMTTLRNSVNDIADCRKFQRNALDYVFPVIKSQKTIFGQYWFSLPKKFVRFAYLNGKVAFTSYVNSATETSLINAFHGKGLVCLVTGFIYDSVICPISFFNDSQCNGQWSVVCDKLEQLNFTLILQVYDANDNTILSHKNVYFVTNGDSSVYKYIPQRQ